MGSMRKSRLSQHKQGRLIEHFVAGTTARTAGRLCGVHRNTAAYYFLRLREIIAYEPEAESEAMFGGEIKVEESYFGTNAKVNMVGALQVRFLYLVYEKGVERFIPRSFRMLQAPNA